MTFHEVYIENRCLEYIRIGRLCLSAKGQGLFQFGKNQQGRGNSPNSRGLHQTDIFL